MPWLVSITKTQLQQKDIYTPEQPKIKVQVIYKKEMNENYVEKDIKNEN